jgi:hypothetical protein
VLSPEFFPELVPLAPQIYAEFSSGIHTNLSFEDALKLAMLVKDIPMECIKQDVIDSSMAIPTDTILNGVPANVLRPVPDLIRILRDEIFVPGGPLSPLAQGMQVVEYGVPTGASNTTQLILYSSKLYALRFLVETFGVGSQQIIIQPEPTSTVDIEIRIGEDWVTRLPAGY